MTQPTLEPVTERILADIEAALAAISTTHPTLEFWHDVQGVFRQDPEDSRLVAYPNLVVHVTGNITSDDLDADIHSINSEHLLVEVIANMREIIDVPKAHQRMIRDIRHAVMQDARRNGLAIHTFVGQSESVYPTSTNPKSTVSVALAITYRTRVDALELQVG